jgi:hypothetical protein
MGGISICHRRRIERNFTPETFRQRIAEILLHGNYEETALEKLARELALCPVHQTDPGKLAREVDVRPARDNGLVPDQKNVATTPLPSETSSPAPVTETR